MRRSVLYAAPKLAETGRLDVQRARTISALTHQVNDVCDGSALVNEEPVTGWKALLDALETGSSENTSVFDR